jgi:hypothetical protein
MYVPLKTPAKDHIISTQPNGPKHKALAPTQILYLSLTSTPCSQFENIRRTCEGNVMLKRNLYTSPNTSRQSKKGAGWIHLARLHPQHFKLPLHCFFARLSVIRVIFLVRSHINLCVCAAFFPNT